MVAVSPVAASSRPALIGLRAAAVVAPFADAFDAAAEAAALTLLTGSAHVWLESGAKAQKAGAPLSLARHPHIGPMPSQQRPDVKTATGADVKDSRRLTSNSTA